MTLEHEAASAALNNLVQTLKDIETLAVTGMISAKGKQGALRKIAAKAHNAVRGL